MDNPLALTATLTVTLALAGCAVLWLATSRNVTLPRLSRGRLVAGLVWLVLAGLLWVSDYPAAWRVPEMVEYLASFSVTAFRFLCVTATGAVLFGSMVALLFVTRPKRRRAQHPR